MSIAPVGLNAEYTEQSLFDAGTNFDPSSNSMDILQKTFYLRDAMYAVPCLEAKKLYSYYTLAGPDYS